jgi:hypothetical protein
MLAQGFQLGPKSRRTFFSRSLYRVDLSISLPRASRLSSSASFQLVMAPIQKLQCYREMGPAYLPVPTAITCVPQFISGRDLSRSRVPKVEKICRRPRLPARTRRRYSFYRRTERSVPDGGLTSCRTSFALHVFGRTDRLKQSPVPTPGTSMLVRGRKMKCVTYADTLGSHRLVANATEVSNTSTAGGGWARG